MAEKAVSAAQKILDAVAGHHRAVGEVDILTESGEE
jgi:hypothetical protein